MFKLSFIASLLLVAFIVGSNASESGTPEPYSYSYNSPTTSHGAQESSDGNTVVGHYFVSDGENGHQRRVDYIADENGFRANVASNHNQEQNQHPEALGQIANVEAHRVAYSQGTGLINSAAPYFNGAQAVYSNGQLVTPSAANGARSGSFYGGYSLGLNRQLVGPNYVAANGIRGFNAAGSNNYNYQPYQRAYFANNIYANPSGNFQSWQANAWRTDPLLASSPYGYSGLLQTGGIVPASGLNSNVIDNRQTSYGYQSNSNVPQWALIAGQEALNVQLAQKDPWARVSYSVGPQKFGQQPQVTITAIPSSSPAVINGQSVIIGPGVSSSSSASSSLGSHIDIESQKKA